MSLQQVWEEAEYSSCTLQLTITIYIYNWINKCIKLNHKQNYYFQDTVPLQLVVYTYIQAPSDTVIINVSCVLGAYLRLLYRTVYTLIISWSFWSVKANEVELSWLGWAALVIDILYCRLVTFVLAIFIRTHHQNEH